MGWGLLRRQRSHYVADSWYGFIWEAFVLLLLFFLCRKKSSESKNSKDIAPAKPAQVQIPPEKTTRDSVSVGARYLATAASKSDVESGGSKNLVFFGNFTKVFDLEDLLKASAEVLGKGTFGTTYKATLEMGMVVAVKRLKEVAESEKEVREKIEEVGKMVHENLVPLRAYYYSRDEKLLVYDYLPIGSLSALLHGTHLFAWLALFGVVVFCFGISFAMILLHSGMINE